MKKNEFLGKLVILLVFGFIGCGNENNDPEIYTVTIGTLKNANGSTITASPASGVEGTEITLTIIGEKTYRLKNGTLKYEEIVINENTLKFNLPNKNVIITAEFQSLLIGEWYLVMEDKIYNDPRYVFFENGIYARKSLTNNGYYFEKGMWLPRNNNIVDINRTHWKNGYVSSLNDFTEDDENPYQSYIYVLSDTTFKFDWDDDGIEIITKDQ